MTDDTIFAVSTPPGRSAVAVIRISGAAARLVLEMMAQPCPVPRAAVFRRLHQPRTGELIDEALVLWFPGPGSETGEDLAELQVHGGRAIVARGFAGAGEAHGFLSPRAVE